jgi:hypothetical protein
MGNFPKSQLLEMCCPRCNGSGIDPMGGSMFSKVIPPCNLCNGSGTYKYRPKCQYSASRWQTDCIGDDCMIWDKENQMCLQKEVLLKQLEIKNV